MLFYLEKINIYIYNQNLYVKSILRKITLSEVKKYLYLKTRKV